MVSAATLAVPRHVNVEFVADVVCPWCYVGFQRLLKARSAAAEQGVTVEFTFTPFILRRHLPKEGIDKIAMFAESGMGEAAARSKFEHIRTTALADGLCLDFEGQRAGNSEDAHRLLLWAARDGADAWTALITQLFLQYNCKRGWLGSPKVLLAAVEVALGTAPPTTCDGDGANSNEPARAATTKASAVLADTASFLPELERGLKRSERLGARGVPLFVIDAATALPGAVPTADLLDAILAAAQRPPRLAQWYVERANAHDFDGLAKMLAKDVDMFGGPCDRSGLEAFFASYPQIQWQVSSAYKTSADDAATVVFSYTRTWQGADGGRLAVDAEEAITFNGEGKVVKIAYTRPPSEPRPAGTGDEI